MTPDPIWKKRQVIDLWQSCFHDSEAFIEIYFNEIYRDENALAAIEGDRVVSALQMVPYSMTCWGTPLPMSYIAGASTYPEARNKGLMNALLKSAFERMSRGGIVLTTLIPADDWLFDYYGRFGYVTVCYERYRMDIPPAPPAEYRLCEPADRQYDYFKKSLAARGCCVQHTRPDFEALIRDLRSDDGDIVAIEGSEGICAMALGYPEADYAEIKESFCDDAESRRRLTQACCDRFGVPQVRYRLPSGPNGIPFGMVRIIDAEPLLSAFAALYPDRRGTIRVSDPLMVNNNAVFSIGGGKCGRQAGTTGTDHELTVEELTRFIFSGHEPFFPVQQPFMSLMFD